MRVVLDTNVVMSGIFFAGAPGRIVEAWRGGRIEVVLTLAILTEYERVAETLARRYPIIDITGLLEMLASIASFAEDQALPAPVCADPDDDKFLACAVSGNVNLVISGDKALIGASGYHGIEVMTPRAFVDKFI